MPNANTRTAGAQQAYTDLYNEQERTFLIRYPTWFLTTVIISGVAAFAIAGFYGQADPTTFSMGDKLGRVFATGPLFLWLCGLIITLQWSIFRHKSLLVERWASIFATLIAMLLVAVYYAEVIPSVHVGNLTQVIHDFVSNLPTLAIINFGIILIFLADSVRRWILCAQGKSFVPHVNIGLGNTITRLISDEPLPKLNELISGDLITGGILIFLLSVFFTPSVVNVALGGLIQHVPTDCTLVPAGLGPCIKLGSAYFTDPLGFTTASLINDPRLLSLVDILTTLLLLIPGLLILAPSALSSVLGTSPEAGTLTRPTPPRGSASTGEISKEVSEEVIETIGAGLTRRFRFSFGIALRDLGLRLRHVLWPLLIVVGVFAIAEYAKRQTDYLHWVRTDAACHTVNGVLSCLGTSVNFGFPDQGIALLAAAIGVAGIVFSAGTLAFEWRVSGNTLLFLSLIGFIFALIFWIISLLLSLINLFYFIVNLNVGSANAQITAFPQISFFTALSFILFLRYAVPWLIRRIREGDNAGPMVDLGAMTNGRRPQPVEVAAPIEASAGSQQEMPGTTPPTDGSPSL